MNKLTLIGASIAFALAGAPQIATADHDYGRLDRYDPTGDYWFVGRRYASHDHYPARRGYRDARRHRHGYREQRWSNRYGSARYNRRWGYRAGCGY